MRRSEGVRNEDEAGQDKGCEEYTESGGTKHDTAEQRVHDAQWRKSVYFPENFPDRQDFSKRCKADGSRNATTRTAKNGRSEERCSKL